MIYELPHHTLRHNATQCLAQQHNDADEGINTSVQSHALPTLGENVQVASVVRATAIIPPEIVEAVRDLPR